MQENSFGNFNRNFFMKDQANAKPPNVLPYFGGKARLATKIT